MSGREQGVIIEAGRAQAQVQVREVTHSLGGLSGIELTSGGATSKLFSSMHDAPGSASMTTALGDGSRDVTRCVVSSWMN